MKKIYILTAIFALLTLSLNAQQLKVDQNGKVVQPKAQAGKVNAPNRAITTGSVIAADGNSTSTGYQWLPVYGYYFESAQTNQMIYTATQLDGLQPGDKITSLTFYPSGNIAFSGGSITLSLGCTSISEFSTNSALNVTTTQVARTTTYPVSNGAWTITFTNPFTYAGENLLVQVATTSGNFGRTYFYGQDQSRYQSRNSYGSTNRYYFLPKIKLDYERSSDPSITVSNNSLSFNSLPGETSSKTLSVTGVNLTDGITASISGTDASLFNVSPSSLGTSGGNLTITYSPTAVGTHSATLTLSSTTAGTQPVDITLNGSSALEMTICDGTNTNGYLPTYGLYTDNFQINQMIYPASQLTSLVGKDITSMTFYATEAINSDIGEGTYTIKLGTTDQTTFASTQSSIIRVVPSDITEVVKDYNLPTGDDKMTITFDTPFTYNGGNLLIDFEETVHTSNYETTNFYGINQPSDTYTGFNSYSSNATPNANGIYTGGGPRNFLPKVTFEYEDNTNPKIEVSPQTLTISDSGTNNTFTVQGSNLGNDNVGATVPNGSAFSTTTSDQWWGFVNNNGSVSGTVTVTYGGRDLSATETVTVANNLTSATVNVTYVPDLYIYCDYGASPWDFSANPAVAMVNNGDGTYTATLQNIPANSHILFGRTTGLTYYWEGDNNRLFFGASTDGGDWGYGDNTSGYLDTDPNDDYPVKYHPIYFSEGGTYTITINANDYTFTINKLVLPPPENVVATASTTSQSATVTWDAPSNLPTVTETVYESVTEDFENQTNFPPFGFGGITDTQHTGAFGEWTLYDGTGGIGGYYSSQINYTGAGEPHAWFVFNPSEVLSGASYAPAGHNNSSQYLESVCPRPEEDGGTCVDADHWLISPEVGGNEISFWVREFTTQYGPETYQVLYSTTDNNPSSFTLIQQFTTSVDSWEQVTVALPAGTKYFAIRHTSNDIFGIMLDDVTYQIATTGEVTVSPVSYNIYLDDVLVGSVPSTTDPLSYNFNNVADGEHTASVSAVYEGGIESALVSDTFTILPKTPAPEISVATGETAYTITATAANPNATVTMTVDGVEYTGTGSVTVTIDRGNADQSVYVSAIAQESGKLVSDPNSQYVNVPAIPVTPTPTITYEQTNSSVVITANGEGTITLTAGGQTVTGEGPISITIMRSLEDQNVTATATAVSPNHQTSDPATTTVPVPALSGTPAAAQEGLLRMHLLVVDQFKEPIPDDNSHPDRYGYILKWEQPANIEDRKESGSVPVDIEKTEAKVNGYYTLSDIESDIDRHLDLDVLTADVSMELPNENPNVLYYQLQGKKDANPALGEDYLTQLQYMKNIYEYEEMLQTSPNKGQHYEANSTYHYYNDWTSPVVTGDYGVNFMTYAPSVSTWGIQRRYFEEDGLDNTYGAPIWKTGVGQVRMVSTEAQLQRGPYESTQWDGVGGPCSLVFLGVEALGDLPSADVSNIVYEPYMFRVWIQSPHNNLRGCTLIPEDPERPVKPGEHWEGDGTVYGAEPILVYEGPTSDGHLFIDVEEPPMDNQPWNSRIQFGALDDGLDDLIVYVRFYYRSTGQGISGRNMMRGNRDDEVPAYNASEGEDNPNITTGIIEMWNGFYDGEVVSRTYVNSLGMQSDEPFDGVNIVITRYSDGKVSTTKVIR